MSTSQIANAFHPKIQPVRGDKLRTYIGIFFVETMFIGIPHMKHTERINNASIA